jgi:deoxyribodipyrimidine photolyase-related protein
METVLILPNQLFEDNKLINSNTTVYLYEHPLYFTKFRYHKMKLILHRSTMKLYSEYLTKKYKCKVKYIEFNSDISQIFKSNKQVDLFDPVDFDIIKEIKKYNVFVHDTPLFLCTLPELKQYLNQGGLYHQTSFYIWQRKRLDILVDNNKKPLKGKWSFDKDNRLPFPKDFKDTTKINITKNKYVTEATNYINKHFKNNPGDTDLYWSIDFEGAKTHLKLFLKNKLDCFGPYQDAVDKNVIFGCHSSISALLNIGLITPKYIIDQIIKYYDSNKKIDFASVEGLIRQIVGWREFMRFMYMFKNKELSNCNHFKHHKKLPETWYTGDTGIDILDNIIQKVLKYAYAHHIERLMYLGNFMLLNQINPKDIYSWFMIFIDAYPWVMAPNVYGMSQYACGPLLSTRPYFSSSNYIFKMSSYRKKDKLRLIKINNVDYEWWEVWDALYYNFINNNKVEFGKNYSTASGVSHWKNKNKEDQKKLLMIANKYIKNY